MWASLIRRVGVIWQAMNTLTGLNRLVADTTDTPLEEVAGRFWQRVSMDLQRANHRVFRRRAGQREDGRGTPPPREPRNPQPNPTSCTSARGGQATHPAAGAGRCSGAAPSLGRACASTWSEAACGGRAQARAKRDQTKPSNVSQYIMPVGLLSLCLSVLFLQRSISCNPSNVSFLVD